MTATDHHSSQSGVPPDAPDWSDHASVVVIGGGVMGCSTLYHLAKAGVSDAVLLERHQLTAGTTWHSAAQVRALRSSQNLTDLIRYSIRLYAELEAETGQATGWINKGSLSIATTPGRLTHIRRQAALARLYGVRAEEVSAAQAAERWPLMNAEDVIGAVWSPDDGRVSPSDLCAALVKGAKARGARAFENTALLGIETAGGRVVGVETSRGRIRTDAVAVCAGLWSRAVAAMGGASAPVWPCEHLYLLTQPMPEVAGNLPTLSDHDAHLYLRDDSGGLLVGCFEPMGKAIAPERLGDNFAFQLLPEDWEHFEPMMLNALRRIPALERAAVKTLLNGPESFTPDGSFLLGETAETRGLFLGCGMNSVGVATGGGAGLALAARITTGAAPSDLAEADPTRFPDCWNSADALSARAPEILGAHFEIAYPGRWRRTARDLRPTPLHGRFKTLGAAFGQFGGWERPLFFGDQAGGENADRANADAALTFGRPPWFDAVGAEVSAAHRGAAVFDQSTFGKIDVVGADACAFLDRVCAARMDRPVGSVIYTAMLNRRGGFESDLTAQRLAEDAYRLVVGATALKRDLAWLNRARDPAERVTLKDCTDAYAQLALMGPDAGRIAATLGGGAFQDLGYFRAADGALAGRWARAARLSYVGEAGWEITLKAADAPVVFDAALAAGARPAGLYAQTAMRVEKGFRAMGLELDADVTPLDVGLGFAVGWDTPFIGKTALEARRSAGPRLAVVSLLLNNVHAVPLGHEPVIRDGRIVGRTTSAAFGYRVGRPVALALIEAAAADGGEESALAAIDIAGALEPAEMRRDPAFDPEGARMRARA